jgi:hypothetical protein
MHELTLGQVYVLLEDMAEYLRRTNPFGPGEEKTPDDPARTVAADEPGAISSFMESGVGLYPAVNIRAFDSVSKDDMDALRRLTEDADGRR